MAACGVATLASARPASFSLIDFDHEILTSKLLIDGNRIEGNVVSLGQTKSLVSHCSYYTSSLFGWLPPGFVA